MKRFAAIAGETLDCARLNKGYLLIYSFNEKKETGVKEVRIGDKLLIEVTV